MALAEPKPKRWTREEYDRLVEAGIFGPEDRVELLDGEIVEMPPQMSRHYAAIELARRALEPAFSQEHVIRIQAPLAVTDLSEPEPDLAVVPGAPRDYVSGHPTTALLVVEVSEAMLAYDRTRKASAYAAAGIPDYWIVNLIDRQLEVRRQPVPMPDQPAGYGYAEIAIYPPGEAVAPLAAPDHSIRVADLLP